MRLSIIVAMDDNKLIGNNNALPWHLPADLAYFKKTTLGKTVLMGRKTYDSIGKPLPNRRNIILSRKKYAKIPNCEVAKSIGHAREICKQEEEIMIIGGMSIYEQFLNPALPEDLFATDISIINRLYVTEVDGVFEGDSYFPEFDISQFVETFRQSHTADENNKHTCHFTILDRKSDH